MKKLHNTFKRVGMNHVVTYINTGNTIFTDDRHAVDELTQLLEEAIALDFGLDIKVVIRDFEQYSTMMKVLPESWTNDQQMKSDVLFLWEDIDQPTVLEQLVIKENIDTVIYVPGTILWSVDRECVTKSGLMKLAASKLYKRMTVRNVNTTRKIYDIMLQVAKNHLG